MNRELINLEYLCSISAFLIILHGLLLIQHMYCASSQKNVKYRCTQKTTGTIQFLNRGIYYAGSKLRKKVGFGYYNEHIYIFHWFTVYSYSAKGQQYTGTDARLPYAFFSPGKPGEEVEIYYNPKDGREFYCPNEDKNAKYGHMALIGLSILIGIAAYFILIYWNSLT